MKLKNFTQSKKNAARFSEIIKILTKYGLANWVKEKDPEFLNGLFTNNQGESFAGLPLPVRLRMALIELGTTFIKLGQILSTRGDLVGPEVADELSKLQAETPSDSEQQIIQTIEDELGDELSTIFSEFDFSPLGSASIGQVHRAKLLNGETVVVKVQHANIEDKITADIEILTLLATLAEKYDPQLRLYQPRSLIKDFSNNLYKELDYNKELKNMELFRANFINQPQIHIPITYPEFSGKRMLTMEYLDGFSIADSKKLQSDTCNKKTIAQHGVNMYLDMIFKDRVFHADPHPGNIWILPNNTIGLLDSGMIGRLEPELQEAFENMLMAVSEKDSVEVTYQITRICTLPKGFDRKQLQQDVDEFIFEFFGRSIESLSISETLNSLTSIIRAHHLLMPTGISLLIRVLIMLEGSSKLLDRSFSINDAIIPYTHKVRLRRFNPKKIAHRLGKSLTAWERLITALPADLETLFDKMRRGSFDVSIQHRHLDAVINRLVYGVLTGSMVLGGSMLLSSEIPPLINGFSVLGGIFIGISVVLGYKLLKAISDSGSLVDKDN